MFSWYVTENATSRLQLINAVSCKAHTEHNYSVWANFDVLLTVHLSIILVINQLNAKNFVL